MIGLPARIFDPRDVTEIGQAAQWLEMLKEVSEARSPFVQNRALGRLGGAIGPRERREILRAQKALDHRKPRGQGLAQRMRDIVAIDREPARTFVSR